MSIKAPSFPPKIEQILPHQLTLTSIFTTLTNNTLNQPQTCSSRPSSPPSPSSASPLPRPATPSAAASAPRARPATSRASSPTLASANKPLLTTTQYALF